MEEEIGYSNICDTAKETVEINYTLILYSVVIIFHPNSGSSCK